MMRTGRANLVGWVLQTNRWIPVNFRNQTAGWADEGSISELVRGHGLRRARRTSRSSLFRFQGVTLPSTDLCYLRGCLTGPSHSGVDHFGLRSSPYLKEKGHQLEPRGEGRASGEARGLVAAAATFSRTQIRKQLNPSPRL